MSFYLTLTSTIICVITSSLYDSSSHQYRKAFLACRKHRVDLNIIVDDSFKQFMGDLDLFLSQIPEVDHINLFLANIG